MANRLIIAFDVGTTFSGVSYAFQDDSGQDAIIHGVTRWPGTAPATSKIPSQLLYQKGRFAKPFRVGQEVEDFENDPSERANLNDYLKVQWFKILLRPGTLTLPSKLETQLPAEVTPVQVFSDYVKYLHECTMKFIKDMHMNSDQLLAAVGTNIHYILTHPNGWAGPQQARMRAAAARAGLVPRPDDHHLHLLSEGEAAINFCMLNGLKETVLKEREGVAVIDAGGGTIDISAYRRHSGSTHGSKIKLEEIIDARCLMRGSVFLNWKAEKHLKKLLKNSMFSGYLNVMCAGFDTFAKLRFWSRERDSWIKFGKIGDNEGDPKHIRNGQIRISAAKMASFFEPSIKAIEDTFQDMIARLKGDATIKHATLVGGFGGSEYLYTELKQRLEPLGVTVHRVDRLLNKAVADGAIAHYLDHPVVTRVAKHTLGTACSVRYDSSNEEHVQRFNTHSYICKEDGFRWMGGLFQPIVTKGTSVPDTEDPQEYTRQFIQKAKDGKFLGMISSTILEYRGDLPGNGMQWMSNEPENYEELCDVKCRLRERTLRDLSNLPKHLGNEGQKYVRCDYDVSLSFGAPELKAQAVLRYKNSSKSRPVEVRSPPQIVYFDRDPSDNDLITCH